MTTYKHHIVPKLHYRDGGYRQDSLEVFLNGLPPEERVISVLYVTQDPGEWTVCRYEVVTATD